jgi:hypothetical protein
MLIKFYLYFFKSKVDILADLHRLAVDPNEGKGKEIGDEKTKEENDLRNLEILKLKKENE